MGPRGFQGPGTTRGGRHRSRHHRHCGTCGNLGDGGGGGVSRGCERAPKAASHTPPASTARWYSAVRNQAESGSMIVGKRRSIPPWGGARQHRSSEERLRALPLAARLPGRRNRKISERLSSTAAREKPFPVLSNRVSATDQARQGSCRRRRSSASARPRGRTGASAVRGAEHRLHVPWQAPRDPRSPAA